MATLQRSTLLCEEARKGLERSLGDLNATLETLEAHITKASAARRDSLTTKSQLQSKLSQAEFRLKHATDELAIHKSSKQDSSNLTERLTALQSEVRFSLASARLCY